MRSLAIAAALLFPMAVDGQSLLERPPNLSGEWTGAPGTLYFHFIHRFTASDAPQRKVSNVPTFLLGAGLPHQLFAGLNYSTNSTLRPQFPNEWELFARWAPVSEDLGAPLDLGGQIGYNNAADGVDGELSAAHWFGRARLLVAARALSDPLQKNHYRSAFAGGAVLRLGTYVSLAGDVAARTSRDSAERVAWSAGVHFAIPFTPHTVSLQATNTLVSTLQGASRGTSDVRYGFEFTVPVTLGRYFGNKQPPPPPVATARVPDTVTRSMPVPAAVAAPRSDTTQAAIPERAAPERTPPTVAAPAPTAPATAARPTARVTRTGIKNISYLQPRLEVTVGTTVEWTNRDPLPHSVTATDKSFDSGLIQPGESFRHTFTRAGSFNFYCVPHPFMKGVVVVRAP
jgi:plastocyanin